MSSEYKCTKCNGTGKAHYFCYNDYMMTYCRCTSITEVCIHPDRNENCKLIEGTAHCHLCNGTGKVDWIINLFNNNYMGITTKSRRRY